MSREKYRDDFTQGAYGYLLAEFLVIGPGTEGLLVITSYSLACGRNARAMAICKDRIQSYTVHRFVVSISGGSTVQQHSYEV